jgi:hypothetical protein
VCGWNRGKLTGVLAPLLDGFERKLISSTDKDMFCFDGDLCGLQAFPTKPVIIKLRCTKKTLRDSGLRGVSGTRIYSKLRRRNHGQNLAGKPYRADC